MPLHNLVYVSLATEDMSDETLKKILNKARTKNEGLDITGMLLYRDGFFMQVLEGEKDMIENLFERISLDARHRDLIVINRKPIKQRSFPDWKMGFNEIDDESIASIEGFSDFLKKPTPEFFVQRASEAEALLDQFKHQLFF